jgi:transposase, IS5 family
VVQQRKNRLDPLCPNGLDADVADHHPQRSLWEANLPEGCLGLPAELARVDALLDDPKFLAPLASHFDPRIGRPSMPLDTYLRIMFLKFRYRLGYELVCRELQDSISWQRFCRRAPHL